MAMEIRVSPTGAEIVERWDGGRWQLRGGTHDGEVMSDDAVEGWTEMVSKAGIEHLVGVWLRRTANDDPRLADKLMNDVAAVVRGVQRQEPTSEQLEAGRPPRPTGEIEDGLARVLAFRFGIPKVDGEPGWFLLPEWQKDEWRGEADMVRGYLVNAEGWKRP